MLDFRCFSCPGLNVSTPASLRKGMDQRCRLGELYLTCGGAKLGTKDNGDNK